MTTNRPALQHQIKHHIDNLKAMFLLLDSTNDLEQREKQFLSDMVEAMDKYESKDSDNPFKYSY